MAEPVRGRTSENPTRRALRVVCRTNSLAPSVRSSVRTRTNTMFSFLRTVPDHNASSKGCFVVRFGPRERRAVQLSCRPWRHDAFATSSAWTEIAYTCVTVQAFAPAAARTGAHALGSRAGSALPTRRTLGVFIAPPRFRYAEVHPGACFQRQRVLTALLDGLLGAKVPAAVRQRVSERSPATGHGAPSLNSPNQPLAPRALKLSVAPTPSQPMLPITVFTLLALFTVFSSARPSATTIDVDRLTNSERLAPGYGLAWLRALEHFSRPRRGTSCHI